jgi:uncharacterized protein YbjT (DUF2867 family)
MDRVLVVGASGALGLEICRQLVARGHSVSALVREGSAREKDLAGLGAETVRGDLKDPRSLEGACQGTKTVVSTATATTRQGPGDTLRTVDRDGNLALLQAAQKSGVRRFVYVSLSPNTPPIDLVRYKQEVETAVRSSGLEWTNLQPSAFMDIWLSPLLGWSLREGRARILGRGDQPVSLVAARDVAQFAVLAAEGRYVNRDLPIGGPEALSATAVLRLAEEVAGRRFRVQRVPLGVLRVVAAVISPFAPIPSNLIRLGLHSAVHGDVIDMGRLEQDLPRPLLSVRDFMRESIAHG